MRLTALLVALAACHESTSMVPDLGPPPPTSPIAVRAEPAETVNPRLLRRFRPLQAPVAQDERDRAVVALGEALYVDPRLSKRGDVACNTCHPLDGFGSDRKVTSTGSAGMRGARNTPTVLNAAGHIGQFWDGRAVDVEEQAESSILDPREMAMPSREAVTGVLRSIPGYTPLFAAAFPGEEQPVTFAHAVHAIAAFERTLVTPSRWDRFLAGDHAALSALELRGLKAFADLGCIGCHTGEHVGASMYQRLGVSSLWPNQRDQGRFQVTHLAADRMVFKVSSLRNAAETAPYFHDGSVVELKDAIRMMARYQLDAEVSDDEVDAIAAWIGSLTGEGVR